MRSEVTPVAISGGTLLALAGGRRVLVADPERDRIQIVDVQGSFLLPAITLPHGAEPGRAVEDKAGRAHVVLRGTGEVLSIDVTTGAVTETRKVCAMPRGIALEPSAAALDIVCAEGKLVRLPLTGAEVLRETALPLDARDVVYTKGKLFVSRFRSAELVEIDENGAQKSLRRLPDVADLLRNDVRTGLAVNSIFEPAVAWRTVAHPSNNGGVVMVHQRATIDDIVIDDHGDTGGANDGPGPVPATSDSSYGGGSFDGCGGIVQSAVSVVTGDQVVTSPQLAGAVLPVDVAVSSEGIIAIASAGGRDLNAPTNFGFVAGSSVQMLTVADLDRAQRGGCISPSFNVPVQEQVVAVAFTQAKQLVVQTREPATLIVIDNPQFPTTRTIPLGGESRFDTGHDIFHRDAGGGLACASCHVEGTDDGRVWHFDPIGARRTQPVDVGLRGTEPFHWDGSLPTMGRLMNEVFVARMGGPRESTERVNAMSEWVFQLRPRAPLRPVMDSSAERGKVLFESPYGAGCATCHSGARFTNNETVDVGTGVALQVPSLLGVSQRLPVMHDGCANTLRERFDASCGGNAHGNVAGLGEAELNDLVAYLESI